MKETRVTFTKIDDEEQIVYGAVYSPMVPDSQGDFMTKSEIRRAAHNFMKSGRVRHIDIEHNLTKSGAVVVESFLIEGEHPLWPDGSWVLGTHVPDRDVWAKIKKGEIGGYSMYGTGRREPRVVEIEIPDDGTIFGKTQQSLDHEHLYALDFDNQGNFLGGETNEVNGHWHEIKKGTVTGQPTLGPGHAHRFDFMEIMKNSVAGYGSYKFQRKRPMKKDDMTAADYPPPNAEQKEAPPKKKKKCKHCDCEREEE